MLNWEDEIKPSAHIPFSCGSSESRVVEPPPAATAVHTFHYGAAIAERPVAKASPSASPRRADAAGQRINASTFNYCLCDSTNRGATQIGPDGLLPNEENAFGWMRETIDLKKEGNFFETRVIEYQSGAALPCD